MSRSRTVVQRWVKVLAAACLAATGPALIPPAWSQEPAPAQVSDLTTRYKFIERYAPDADKAQPGEIGQYRVALRDVLKVMDEKPQATPGRSETTVQIIYGERPTALNNAGAVTDTIRHYEALRITPAPETKPSTPKTLDGLTLWYKVRPNATPLVLSLTPDRGLTETEYAINSRVIFMPDLAAALPALPSRIGDRWRIPRPAAQALFGDRPLQGEPPTATLVDVRKAPEGDKRVAVIRVVGRAMLPPNGADTALNAQITFTFDPPAAAAESGAPVEARGAITDLRLAKSSTAGLPGSNGRLKRTFTHELNLQRRLSTGGDAIAVPNPLPEPNEANSWLTYNDPQGRFHFRHPQELQLDPRTPPGDTVQLRELLPNGYPDRVFSLEFQPKSKDPKADRDARDPEFHKKSLNEAWARDKQEVLRGPSDWLPEADWAPYKMKVYRIEAALKTSGPSPRDAQRVFLDYYLILTAQNESLVVEAMTVQDPPLPYRKQVEAILKTFQFGTATAPAG